MQPADADHGPPSEGICRTRLGLAPVPALPAFVQEVLRFAKRGTGVTREVGELGVIIFW